MNSDEQTAMCNTDSENKILITRENHKQASKQIIMWTKNTYLTNRLGLKLEMTTIQEP